MIGKARTSIRLNDSHHGFPVCPLLRWCHVEPADTSPDLFFELSSPEA